MQTYCDSIKTCVAQIWKDDVQESVTFVSEVLQRERWSDVVCCCQLTVHIRVTDICRCALYRITNDIIDSGLISANASLSKMMTSHLGFTSTCRYARKCMLITPINYKSTTILCMHPSDKSASLLLC